MALEPMYHIIIQEVHTEQTVYSGVHKGALGPLLDPGGLIRDGIEKTDVGRLLGAVHHRKAFRRVSR